MTATSTGSSSWASRGDELAIVFAELDVKDVDGVGQGVGQELATCQQVW
jgi:hypothetical protein